MTTSTLGSAPSLAGLHILIVEDEAILAFSLAEDLEAVGAVPVGPAASVKEGLAVVRDGARLDAALLNVRLRGELSFPIAEALRARGVPFVFVTGNDPAVTRRYPDVPVHPKPADMPAVVRSLAALVGARSAPAS